MTHCKEAIILCLDVGVGMQSAAPGQPCVLDLAKKVVSTLIKRKIFSESKDEIALVLFGCEETANELASEDDTSYSNVMVAYPFGSINFDLLEYVSHSISPSSTQADFLDAVTVCLDLFYKETRGKKLSSRRLVLFTNFNHECSDDSLEGIINGFSADEMDIELNVISPNFDFSPQDVDGVRNNYNDDLPPNEGPGTSHSNKEKLDHQPDQFLDPTTGKPKSENQISGEKLITKILKQGVSGACYSFRHATTAVAGFEKRSIKSVAWKCNLMLGQDLAIPCIAYIKTKEAKLKQRWKKCHAKTHKIEDITRNQYYHVEDDQQTEVKKEDVGKGYKYGKDIIPFGVDDEKQMKYTTDEKCLSILGFTDTTNVPPYLYVDDQTHFVISDHGDNVASTSLSAIILGMQNQQLCAIARYVYRKGTNPKLVALIPHDRPNYRCFLMVSLPFSEDMRPFHFPSLTQKKSQQPTEGQLRVMDDLISAMDLSKDKNEEEIFVPKNMLNPYFQHTFQCLHHRIQNPHAPLSEPDVSLTGLNSHDALLEKSQNALKSITKMFSLQRQTNKDDGDGKKMWKSEHKNDDYKNGDDIKSEPCVPLAEMTRSAIQKVGTVSPDSDFIALLSKLDVEDDVSVKKVFQQLQNKIEDFVSDPFALQLENKIISCLKTLIQQASLYKETENVNIYLKQIKSKLTVSNKGLREAFILNKITPTDESRSAEVFWSDQASTSVMDVCQDDEQDADELLDMIE